MRPLDPHRSGRTQRAYLAALALALAASPVAACGDDAGTPTADRPVPTTGTADDGSASLDPAAGRALLPPPDGADLPPNDVAALASIYDPALATLGLRLTRGALIDLSDGGYNESDTGTHLALYAAPIDGTFTPEQYAERIAPLSNLVTPDVFARWPGLASYDICQEGPDLDDDPETEPPTVSQINLEREALGVIDWSNATLSQMFAAAARNRTVRLIVGAEVRNTALLREVQREMAGRTTPPDGTAGNGAP